VRFMEPIIHIIDDDRSFRTALGRLVETYGFHASSYESGEDFLARMPESEVGCIVLDLHMPGLSGPELQERLALAVPLLPIIFLTGQGTIAASVQAMKAGADDFLEKPISSQILREVIERALAKNELRRAGHNQIQALQAKVFSLTPREIQVFDLVVRGKRNKQVAYDLNTSERTIKAHRHSIMEKLGVTSLAEMVSVAERLRSVRAAQTAPNPSDPSPKVNIQRR
jgi:FixJ family two-component response regulator